MCPPKEEAGAGAKGPVTRQMDGARSDPGNVGVGPCWGRRLLPPDALKDLRSAGCPCRPLMAPRGLLLHVTQSWCRDTRRCESLWPRAV
uniref:Uncharacterized protein n=1 Tax=Rangifer tarandus platyrhynchus TaxID=3082113 RepID=A0ACB0DPY2_RANTA|nr:unnamed protein product [Rangifer tarandus platyrhynchus]